MTIVTTDISSGPYTAVAQTTFNVSFQSAGPDEIRVTLDGADVLSGYVFNREDDGTGEVVFTLPVTGQVEIFSDPSFQQGIEFQRFGAFYPDQIDPALDKAAARDLYLRWLIGETFNLSIDITGAIGTASRTAMAVLSPAQGTALLLEPGRSGSFLHYTSAAYLAATGRVLATDIAADPLQGVLVATLTGAWVRTTNGSVNVRWFGAKGDGVTNDTAAFDAAKAYLHAVVTTGYGYGKGSPGFFIPAGVYYVPGWTLDFNHTVVCHGESAGGYAGAGGSVLKGNGTATMLRTQRPDTTGATGAGGTDYGASATIIRNLTIDGGYAGGAEGEFHGIQMRCVTVVRDCLIQNCAGDGIYTKTKLSAPNTGYLGSSSGSVIDNCTIQGCRSDIYIEEVDSNALLINNCLLASARRYGLWSKTTLGSTLIGGVIATNGWNAANPTLTTLSGNRYFVAPGQEAAARTTSPSGTTANNAVWLYFSAGGVVTGCPAWVNNTIDYRSGGAMRLESSYDQWLITGAYVEPDEAPIQIADTCQALVISPMAGNPIMFDGSLYGGVLHGNGTTVIAPRAFHVGLTGGSGYFARLGGTQVDDFARFQNTAGQAWGISGAGGFVINHANAGVNPIYLTSPESGITFGRSAAVTGAFMSQLMALGYSNAGRIVDMAAAAPTTGNHAQGEIVWNNAPTAGGTAKWICTVSGTPGTWVAIPALNAASTGWVADTGTAKKTATATYAPGTNLTFSAGYVQAEATAVSTRLQLIEPALRDATQEIKAIKDALMALGLLTA